MGKTSSIAIRSKVKKARQFNSLWGAISCLLFLKDGVGTRQSKASKAQGGEIKKKVYVSTLCGKSKNIMHIAFKTATTIPTHAPSPVQFEFYNFKLKGTYRWSVCRFIGVQSADLKISFYCWIKRRRRVL